MNPVLPESHDLILVGILPEQRDLEIAKLFGWYRIPFRFAPKLIRADYLAFYQTASFGDAHANMIETFAEVRGVELTTRADLIQDEPNHPRANEQYYKIQIGPIHFLPKPIPSGKWKRITFLYTTGKHFISARTINDLVVKDEERELLWHSLREKAETKDCYQSNSDLSEIDPEIIFLIKQQFTNRIDFENINTQSIFPFQIVE